jgi:Na+-driven multidrug efflux pump
MFFEQTAYVRVKIRSDRSVTKGSSLSTNINSAARAPRSAIAQPPRERLLHGPIVRTLLALSVPSTIVMIFQILVVLAEMYFVSFLGTDAIAAITVVFPGLTFMQLVANGDIGGGLASAIACAMGAGRKDDADILTFCALVLSVVGGAVFSIAEFLWGSSLYQALGAEGKVLGLALSYSAIVFGAAIVVWLVSLLAAALRGSGNVLAPAVMAVSSALIVIPLSPLLIFGWGPFPSLGITGAAVALVTYCVVAAVGLLWYLRSGRGALYLRFNIRRMERRLLDYVLRIGRISAVRTAQTTLTILMITGAVGLFGPSAIAGYGIASRLDFLMIPLLFGLGTSVLTMVSANLGGGQPERAYRIAITGTLVAVVLIELLGLTVALAPNAWLRFYSADPDTLAQGGRYLQTVGPFYGLFAGGVLIFAIGQALGRLTWVFLAATVRMLVVAVGGWIAIRLGGGLPALFTVVGASYVAFSAVNALTLQPRAWRAVGAEPKRPAGVSVADGTG